MFNYSHLMISFIIFFPLAGSIISAFGSNLLGKTRVGEISTAFIGIFLASSLLNLADVLQGQLNNSMTIGSWISNGMFLIEWKFLIDNLTSIMLIVVSTISFLVHMYSLDYMGNDPHKPRFMSYISLFTFFMILLITGDNFLILFLGWEGVGLCSYLLISFWYTRIQANKSAIKALVVNRVSDFALTIGLVCIYFVYKTMDFSVVFSLTPLVQNDSLIILGNTYKYIDVISILLFIGAMGKSAQLGLHTWLPDAMEGPTPVSALIHAATMVTAGVFLIIKCSPVFEYAPKVLVFVTFIGALTAFFSATVGLVQNDIKKVIAYSTCSQLGYMILACGLSNYHVAFFHLSNHAFFKALLFLTAGAIIHSLMNEQDMRKYGSLLNLLPFTSTMLLIGSLALMGFPFLTGFYSKDLILEVSFAQYTISGTVCHLLGIVTAFFTAFYSYRVFFLTFLYKNNSFKAVLSTVHELPFKMAFALIVLSLGSIFLGYFAKDLFVGLGTPFWNPSILILPENNHQFNAEFIPQFIKLLPFFGTLLAVTLGNFIFYSNININSLASYSLVLKRVYSFLIFKWYFDVIYNKFINKPLLMFSYTYLFNLLDKGFFEHSGPVFFKTILKNSSTAIGYTNTGFAFRPGYFMVLVFMVGIILAFEILS